MQFKTGDMDLQNGFRTFVNLDSANPHAGIGGGEEIQKDFRNSLSLKARLEVIRLASTEQYSSRRLAELFKCGRTQILSTLREKSKYLEVAKIPGLIQRKRLTPKLRFGAVNDRVQEWLNEAISQDLVITGPILQLKAREIAAELGLNHFQASNGWLESFRKRTGLSSQNNREARKIEIENENDEENGEYSYSMDPLAIDFEDGEFEDGGEDEVNPVIVVPEVILEEDELDWKQGPTTSSSSSANIPRVQVRVPETVHLISLTQAVRHLEDLKTLATALNHQSMLQSFSEHETVIKNIIISRTTQETEKTETQFQFQTETFQDESF